MGRFPPGVVLWIYSGPVFDVIPPAAFVRGPRPTHNIDILEAACILILALFYLTFQSLCGNPVSLLGSIFAVNSYSRHSRRVIIPQLWNPTQIITALDLKSTAHT